jgi:hypothetical protein
MKYFLTYLLVISLGVNAYFIIYLLNYKREADQKRVLNFWKNITYKEGYKYLESKMKNEYSNAKFRLKPTLVYFWNTETYDYNNSVAMNRLDSLASNLGEYSFNYIFATEMDQFEANSFLDSRGVKFKNFKVLGGMDDFISGVYNEKPPKRKLIMVPKQRDLSCPDIMKLKVTGFYLLIDNKGKILYHNYKFYTPLQDTALMRRLLTSPSVKKLEN